MRTFLFLTLFFYTIVGSCAHTTTNKTPKEEKPIIVAVIDTGFDFKSTWEKEDYKKMKIHRPKMCKFGHKDFTGHGLEDNHGHGTHIAGLVGKYAGNANYCIVVLKYFDGKNNLGLFTDVQTLSNQAFQTAINLKVNVINYSAGGKEIDEKECTLVKQALDMGIRVVAAAGNESANINKTPYYPAMCDNRIETVANITDEGKYASSSNYSNSVELNAKALFKEKGVQVLSIFPNDNIGFMTGTSQSAAIHTGKIIKKWKVP